MFSFAWPKKNRLNRRRARKWQNRMEREWIRDEQRVLDRAVNSGPAPQYTQRQRREIERETRAWILPSKRRQHVLCAATT
jgi:hypothetical protein